MDKTTKHINRLELEHIVNDFKINNYKEGILIVESDTNAIGRILNTPFRSHHYTILTVPKGKIKVKVNMFEYEMDENKVLVISTSAIKEFISVKENSLLVSLLFTENFVINTQINQHYKDSFIFHTTQSHSLLQIKKDEYSDIQNLFSALKNLLTRNEKYPASVLVFFSILNLIAELMMKNQQLKDSKNRQGELIIKFFRLLPANINKHRNVTFYAEKLNINPHYLSNTLKEKTGKTALKLIAEMVILEAKVLLSDPNLSVNEISERLNFPDQFTFSKYFKQYSGITPTKYRNN